MLSKLKTYIKKQSFQPNISSLIIYPFFLLRFPLFKKIKKLSPQIEGSLIDLGCGKKPYENLFKVHKYTGVDVEVSGHSHSNSKIDVYYDGKKLPFENETFDSVVCFEVLEHVFNPDEILPELNRVLKKNAKGIITVPFCWNEHEVPYDYARYSSFGIKHLLEKNGFKVLEVHKTGKFSLVIIELIILGVFEFLKPIGIFGYLLTTLIALPLNIIGGILFLIPSKNPSLYFNSVVLIEKK